MCFSFIWSLFCKGFGLIDNGSELFGNNTRLANGQNAVQHWQN